MNFDYDGLKGYVGKQIGEWEGYPVYISSKKNVLKMSNHTMYVLYDDNNTIICNKGNGFFVYGKVDREGNVTKCSPKRYLMEAESKIVKEKKPTVETKAKVMKANVEKSEPIDIDKYLEDMKKITIEEMLVGVRGEL